MSVIVIMQIPLYFWLLVLSIGSLIMWGYTKKGRIYEYPFLIGIAFAGFVLPQALGIVNNQVFDRSAVDRLLLFGSLCALMCLVGYRLQQRSWQGFGWEFNPRRIEFVAVAMLVAGLVFYNLLWAMTDELRRAGTSGWSGQAVAYNFFADLLRYSLFIGLLLFLRRKSKIGLIVFLLSSYPVLYAVIVRGRRAETAEIVLGVLLAVWFVRGWVVPRWIFVPVALFAMLIASFSAGDYRFRAADGITLEEVREIPWRENVVTVLATGGAELPEALYTIDYAARFGLYDYGAFHWDRLVFNYVPAQLLGGVFKASLYLNLGIGTENISPTAELLQREYNYRVSIGATSTGLRDAFASFGYLGCIKFFIIAYIMSIIYGAAIRGDFVAQLLYLLVVVDAMQAITHNTHWFFGGWPHMLIFLLPALLFARRRKRPGAHAPQLGRLNPDDR